MFIFVSDARRRASRHLLVILLVVGLTLIEQGEGEDKLEHNHGHKDKNPESVCDLPPKVEGVCFAHESSWSYDKSAGKCVHWIYRGCGGNANRFSRQSDCERTCRHKSPHVSTSTTPRSDSGKLSNEERCNLPAKYVEKENPVHKLGIPRVCGIRFPIRWSYDKSVGKCVKFGHVGCVFHGNANSFGSQSECEETCLSSQQPTSSRPALDDKATDSGKERCDLPSKVSGKCLAYNRSWSYVKSSGKCEKFIWGGCGGNANKFKSQSECEEVCLHSSPSGPSSTTPSPNSGKLSNEERCNLPAKYVEKEDNKHGVCGTLFPSRWSYDKSVGKCVEFGHVGCVFRSNANSFGSQSECEETCLSSQQPTSSRPATDSGKEICDLPSKVSGNCLARVPGWSYVKSSGKCERFIWGGCGGNANNFGSQSKCEQTCAHSSSTGTTRLPGSTTRPDGSSGGEDICKLPMAGHDSKCKRMPEKMWYYNSSEGKCLEFLHTCGGNANKFSSLKACEQACQSKSSPPLETTPLFYPKDSIQDSSEDSNSDDQDDDDDDN